MRIAVLVEGKTEMAFKPSLIGFLHDRLPGRMPKLDFMPFDGRIPKGEKLRRIVEKLLTAAVKRADAVIALTDVYTGTGDFRDAVDAKQQMRSWVGPNPAFHPHAAQYEFETWLLPYWSVIQELAGHKMAQPSGSPETVNHQNPPSWRLRQVFRAGSRGQAYVKVRDAQRILRRQNLEVAATACPELRAMLNTILTLCGGTAF